MSMSSLTISPEVFRNRRWPQVLRKITPRVTTPTKKLKLLMSTRSLKISRGPRLVQVLNRIPVEYTPVLQILDRTPLLAQDYMLRALEHTQVLQPTALSRTVSKLTHHPHRAGKITSRQEIHIQIEKNSIHVSRPSVFLCHAV
jgi:hypothetical protein